jgi:hypothetical protein
MPPIHEKQMMIAEWKKSPTIAERLSRAGWKKQPTGRYQHPKVGVQVEMDGRQNWAIYRNGMKVKHGSLWHRLVGHLKKIGASPTKEGITTFGDLLVDVSLGISCDEIVLALVEAAKEEAIDRVRALTVFRHLLERITSEPPMRAKGGWIIDISEITTAVLGGDIPERAKRGLRVAFKSGSAFGGEFVPDDLTIYLTIPKRVLHGFLGLTGDLDQDALVSWLHERDPQTTFVHEFTHYLQFLRADLNDFAREVKRAGKSKKDNFNNPLEIDAYFQGVASRFHDQLFFDVDNVGGKLSRFVTAVRKNLGRDLGEFQRKFIEQLEEYGFWTYLTPENRSRVLNRMGETYDDLMGEVEGFTKELS